jgi:sigma-B regulation protein RsbU (phosphoserine phosphatase)
VIPDIGKDFIDLLAAVRNVQDPRSLSRVIDPLRRLGSALFKEADFLVAEIDLQGNLKAEWRSEVFSMESDDLIEADIVLFEGRDAEKHVKGTRSLLLLPFRTPSNRLIGALLWINVEDPFAVRDSRRLSALKMLLNLAVSRAYRERERRALDAEMSYAWQVFKTLLPTSTLEWENYELTGLLIPASKIGGDIYDYFATTDGRIGFFAADATGKGTGPCLQAATCRAYFRALVTAPTENLEEVARNLNQLVHTDVREEKFVTAFFGWISLSSQTVVFVNAGLGSSFLLRGSITVPLQAADPPLGIFREIPFETHTYTMEPGDLLAVFTDGWTERRSTSGTEYGEENLARSLAGTHGLPAREAMRSVYQRYEAECQPTRLQDDVTSLFIRRTH